LPFGIQLVDEASRPLHGFRRYRAMRGVEFSHPAVDSRQMLQQADVRTERGVNRSLFNRR